MVSSFQAKQLRAALGPLEGREAIFVSESCLHRYLRARNGDVKKAERMLRNTLKWRAEYKPEEIKWVSGGQVVSTFTYIRCTVGTKPTCLTPYTQAD